MLSGEEIVLKLDIIQSGNSNQSSNWVICANTDVTEELRFNLKTFLWSIVTIGLKIKLHAASGIGVKIVVINSAMI